MDPYIREIYVNVGVVLDNIIRDFTYYVKD